MREFVSATAPSHWAPYLINGDASGLEPDDIDKANTFALWLAKDGLGIVSCEDAGFIWNHDAVRFGAGASDCQRYIAYFDHD